MFLLLFAHFEFPQIVSCHHSLPRRSSWAGYRDNPAVCRSHTESGWLARNVPVGSCGRALYQYRAVIKSGLCYVVVLLRQDLPASFRAVQTGVPTVAAMVIAAVRAAEIAMPPVAAKDPAAAGTVLRRPTHRCCPFDIRLLPLRFPQENRNPQSIRQG